LLAEVLWKAEARHCAKFRQNQSIHCGDIAIFQDGCHPRHLDLFVAYLDHPLRVLGGLHHFAKIGYDQCRIFYNMNASIFGTFG